MEEKTTNERIYIFYKQLSNKLEFYKKLCIENIQKDIKNEKTEIKKNEYLDLSTKFYYLFEDEIKIEREIEESIKDEETTDEEYESIFDVDLPIQIDEETL